MRKINIEQKQYFNKSAKKGVGIIMDRDDDKTKMYEIKIYIMGKKRTKEIVNQKVMIQRKSKQQKGKMVKIKNKKNILNLENL